jgi:hypothetical protein
MPDEIHDRAPWWAFVLVALALVGFIAVGVVSYLGFNRETEQQEAPWVSGEENLSEGVFVTARTLKVDPTVNQVTFRLDFEPRGALADANHRLARPVKVGLGTDTGTVIKDFKAGDEIRSQDVTVPLYDGYQGNYPFDNYKTQVVEQVGDQKGDNLPSTLAVIGSVHGFSFSLNQVEQDPGGAHAVTLGVKRSGATRLFAIFVMIMFWVLALTALGLMFRVILLGRKIEFPMFTFLAAMLFAFPAVRNTLPGAPPLGVRLDYLSFFWCEMLVAFSLIVALGVWVTHRAAADPPAEPESDYEPE